MLGERFKALCRIDEHSTLQAAGAKFTENVNQLDLFDNLKMDIFEKTSNGIVQHGPCPYCGEWNCSHNDTLYSPTPERVRMREEAQARMKERLDSRRNRSPLVPGWPFPTRKSA
jgi:hypothetical protein